MASLLDDVETNTLTTKVPTKNVIKSGTRHKVRILSPPLSEKSRAPKQLPAREDDVPLPPRKEEEYDEPMVDLGEDAFLADDGDDNVPTSEPLPSSPVAKVVERKMAKMQDEDDDDDMLDVAQAIGHDDTKATSVNMAGNRPPPKIKKEPYPSPSSSSPPRAAADVEASWDQVTSKLNVLSSPATDSYSFGKVRAQDVAEDDGSVRMFWIDYAEVNGSLCLFGKVKNKTTGSYVSAFVKIDNILRKLYFLPRQYRQKNGVDTDEQVDMEDVYVEVDQLMSKLKVGMHKIKPCTRKYAFELKDVPREAEYLKLLYPYDKPALPMDIKGETFSRVFGTNTALFEQFVLWKNVMGPCWLEIPEADFTAVNNSSWCKFECLVTKPALITPLPDSDMATPPMTLMSLAFRTQLNAKENKQEIIMASARVYENVSITDPTPPEKLPCKTFTVMRPPHGAYPIGLEAETKKHRGTYMLEKSEQILLSKFLALFERMDPDVLMGHQLQEVDLGILLSRMKEKKTPGWHRVGRLKRGDWPKTFGRASGFFADRHLVAGRLVCDLANDMGKVSRAL